MSFRLPSHRPRALKLDRRNVLRCLLGLGVAAVLVQDTGTAGAAAGPADQFNDAIDATTAAPVCSSDWLATVRDDADPQTARDMRVAGQAHTPIDPPASDPPRASYLTAALHDLEQDPSARYPNDPLFRFFQRRSLMLMGALDAWDTSRGAPDITVAVISTGVHYGHPDLTTKIWRNPGEVPGNGVDDDANGYVDDVHGWNFPAESNDPMDIPKGRGTMMAGIIGAATNNLEGVAGTSWGARVMPLKTLVLLEDEDGQRAVGTLRDIVEAVCYAANNGAQVIAFGGYLRDPDSAADDVQRLHQAIRYAHDGGAVLVAPAGDCGEPQQWCPSPDYGPNPPIFPAAFDEEVIGAQAFGLDYTEREEASGGYWVDISAPGEGFMSTILSDLPYVEIKPQRATSDFAAAHVAGVLAVMRGVNPNASQAQLEDLLCRTADRPRGVDFEIIGDRMHNDRWGCGYVNFDHVLDEIEPLVRVSPSSLRQFTDGSKPWPSLVFENPYLRASRWVVTPVDALWLVPDQVMDGTDGVSRAYVHADLDKLEGQNGTPVTARLRACPLGVHADDERLCQDLEYELRFVEHVTRLHLPAVVNAAPLGDSNRGPGGVRASITSAQTGRYAE